MTPLVRKPLLWVGAALLALGLAGAAAVALAAAAPDERVVSVMAMKFEFQPETINLKKGQPVVFELSSFDRTHGFYIPELGLRTDVLADTTVRVHLVPQKVGRFTFRCDNFCGDGHEDMEGKIVVSE